MDSANEFNRIDDNSDHFHSSLCNLNADSGDIIDCSNNNDEKLELSTKSQLITRESIDSFLENDGLVEPYPTSEDSIEISHHHIKTKYSFITEHPLTHVDSQHAILIERELPQTILFENEDQIIEKKIDDEPSIILPEKIDLKDLNPYEPSPPQLLIHNKSILFSNSSFMCESLLLPQFVQDYVESYQQLWSPQVYSTESIDANTSQSALSVSKLIINASYSCAKILRYDTVLFGFCYLIGAVLATNVYFFIDFLLIVICIISILVATYEKWLFHHISLNEYNNNGDELNNNDSQNQYWRRIKLAAYGLVIGTISTYII